MSLPTMRQKPILVHKKAPPSTVQQTLMSLCHKALMKSPLIPHRAADTDVGAAHGELRRAAVVVVLTAGGSLDGAAAPRQAGLAQRHAAAAGGARRALVKLVALLRSRRRSGRRGRRGRRVGAGLDGVGGLKGHEDEMLMMVPSAQIQCARSRVDQTDMFPLMVHDTFWKFNWHSENVHLAFVLQTSWSTWLVLRTGYAGCLIGCMFTSKTM